MMGNMSHQPRRPGPGRPRHSEQATPSGEQARDEVLDVAARLFTQRGYAATSTRHIAEAVGIRQASLYYHFPTKDHILAEVLAQTIRPTLENVDAVRALAEEPETALYLLVLLDVRTLVKAPHNSGLLGMLPDVARKAPEFAQAHADLATAYGRLGAKVAPRYVIDSVGKQLGGLLLQQVETVITWISNGTYTRKSPDIIAASCLRICVVDEDAIDAAAIGAHARLAKADEVANA